jgi:hypothetical protein
MPNTNCLAGMACPECGSEAPLNIVCTATYTFYDDGTDYDHDGIEWDEDSPCQCKMCCHTAKAGDFKISNHKEKEKQ